MSNYILGDAEVAFPDWRGNAQLDQRMTAPGLARIIGLNEEEWMTIAFDIGGSEKSQVLRVYAVNRELIPEGSDVLPKIAAANGGRIPVTEFLVHDVDPYEVLRAITHQFQMRLRLRGVRDLPIEVVALGDVPE